MNRTTLTQRLLSLPLVYRSVSCIYRHLPDIEGLYLKALPLALGKNELSCIMSPWETGVLPPFFFPYEESDPFFNKIQTMFPGSAHHDTLAADTICQHTFDLLGSGPVNLGSDIDWHRDFKTGFSWNPGKYYLKTCDYVSCYLDKEIPADVKVPWELSRFQHIITLGKAYRYTSDNRYAEEYISETEHWIRKNPVGLGVNWACTMDVAIRAVNWIWGIYLFVPHLMKNDNFRLKLASNLFLHGRHIRSHLEDGPVRGNHFLSDIVGLVYLGIFFKHTQEGKNWRDFGIQTLIHEMMNQVTDEGVDYEGSINYHFLTTELFLSSTILCIRNGITFPEEYLQRLGKMVDFIAHYIKPDGLAPQIGDNDDGRLHILSQYTGWNRRDHTNILSTAGILFSRRDLIDLAGGMAEDTCWLCTCLMDGDLLSRYRDGKVDHSSRPEKNAFITTSLLSNQYPKGGYHILRSRDNYMIVDTIPPTSPLGHKHNSRLSFELAVKGKTILVDPGAYIYTADKNMRNQFRSTATHNTIVIDNTEQNTIKPQELFSIGTEAHVTINRWDSVDDWDILDAEHDGYTRLPEPVIHRRIIYFNKTEGYWGIRDQVSGVGNHRCEMFFHFAPMDIRRHSQDPGCFIIHDPEGTTGPTVLLVKTSQTAEFDLSAGWISYSYGTKIPAPVLKVSVGCRVPVSFETIIYPQSSNLDIQKIRNSMDSVINGNGQIPVSENDYAKKDKI